MNIAELINNCQSINLIDEAYEKNFSQRRRLGLSQVGHPCKRFLWYKHKGYDERKPQGRTLRLFQLGNILEDQMVEDLQLAGFTVFNKQWPVKFTMDSITLTGSIDGMITGLLEAPKKKHLWEMKTMGSKGFKKLLKDGYESYNPQYKAQIHAYMLGLGLDRAFVTVYNKDTSELYQERIKLNKEWIIDCLQDVFQAIQKPGPPMRACPDADFYEAKWCCFYKECWGI